MQPFPAQGIFSSLKDRKIRFINRKTIAQKSVGDSVWIRFTFFLESGRSVVADKKEVLILS